MAEAQVRVSFVVVFTLFWLWFRCLSGSGPTNWSLFIGRSEVDI